MRHIAWIALMLLGATLADASPKRGAKSATQAPPPSRLAGLEIFQFDAAHSPIDFEVAWMGLSKVRGGFDDCVGTLVFDGKDVTRSSVTIVAHTASLHTNSAQRDKDLRGPDWFDVEKFPLATFRSQSIVRDGDGYRMRGPLTIHGVTKEVEFPFTFVGRLERANHEVRIGFDGQLVINRRDFGIVGPPRFNVLTELGKAMISDEVQMPIAVEGWRFGAQDTLNDRAADSLFRRVNGGSFATVAKEYRAKRAQTPDSLMAVTEGSLNSLGYAFLEYQRPQLAVETFQLEAEAYPKSVFPHTGLAQAYATLGDSARAVESGRKAVAMNPNAIRALEILRRLGADQVN